MGSNFFMYLSAIEGLMIICMLAWEIFWLRRMYQAIFNLNNTFMEFMKTMEVLKGSVVDKFSGLLGGLFKP